MTQQSHKALVARLESLMTEVRNNIYLPNYDFELVADNLSAAESIVVDLCGPIDSDVNSSAPSTLSQCASGSAIAS